MKEIDEAARLYNLTVFERPFWSRNELVAGIDEAGRGPLAGPVVAAAVILPPGCMIEGVNDSKKLSEKKRQALYDKIMNAAVSFGVGIVDNRVIDEINILSAAKRAFAMAYNALKVRPAFVYTDRIGGINIDADYEELTKGDARCYSVAAASIIAKVTRDEMMRELGVQYPVYGFAQHKGYGTKQHRQAILDHGVCGIHRMSFMKKVVK